MKKKTEKTDWGKVYLEFSMLIFCVSVPLLIFRDFIIDQDIITQVVFVLMFMGAGIGFFVIIVNYLNKIWREVRGTHNKEK